MSTSVKAIGLVKTCPILGKPKELYRETLPTIEECLKYFMFAHNSLVEQKVNTNVINSKAFITVAEAIADIWKRASIPIVSRVSIIQQLKQYQKKKVYLLKSYKRDSQRQHFQKSLNEFKQSIECLLDIAICKCPTEYVNCRCEKINKIPPVERDFIRDQRTLRQMKIGLPEIQYCKKMEARKLKEYQKCHESSSGSNSYPENETVEVPVEMPNCEQNVCVNDMNDNFALVKTRNLLQLTNLPSVLDRYKISDRIGAAIASATLLDVGIINKRDKSKIIDQNKVRRARIKSRIQLQSELSRDPTRGLYFDGRKDHTIALSEDLKRRTSSVEEHIVLIEEPGSNYIGHVSPISSSACNIFGSIREFFEASSKSLNKIEAVGCDGTVTNTGHKNGIIVRLERHINTPVQWFVCQLHANELPLRHLIQHLDGNTAGPNVFAGVLGKALQDCDKLLLVNFTKINVKLPEVPREILSTDQAYLYDICKLVSTGLCDEGLSKRQPGKLVHSRWLTTANRILRLYVSTKSPSSSLKTLAIFVTNVYAPMWFKIKTNPSCIHGAQHLFDTIQLSRYLPQDLKNVIDPVIQRNGYFGHPENVLLTMLADNNIAIRELAFQKIVKIRSQQKQHAEGRTFVLPKFNFGATVYYDLIDWKGCNLTEPPLLINVSEDDLKKIVENPLESPIFKNIVKFPCHTQAVERAVKLVTEASMKVTDEKKRDGVIRNTIFSRSRMPHFNTKKEFLLE